MIPSKAHLVLRTATHVHQVVGIATMVDIERCINTDTETVIVRISGASILPRKKRVKRK
jgi:hypothetical protein